MRALWASDGAAVRRRVRVVPPGVVEPQAGPGHDPDRGRRALASRRRARRPARRRVLPREGHPAELAELIDIVRQTAADHGRDPAAIELTAGTPGVFGDDPVGAVQELASVGVSRDRGAGLRPHEAERLGRHRSLRRAGAATRGCGLTRRPVTRSHERGRSAYDATRPSVVLTLVASGPAPTSPGRRRPLEGEPRSAPGGDGAGSPTPHVEHRRWWRHEPNGSARRHAPRRCRHAPRRPRRA